VYDALTSLFHVFLGFLTVVLMYSPWWILVATVFILYENVEGELIERDEDSYIGDVVEYVVGLSLGLGYVLLQIPRVIG